MIPPQDQATASLLNKKVAAARIPNDTNPSPLAQLGDDSVIVTGTKHKISILQEYKRELEMTARFQLSQGEKVAISFLD